MVISSRAVLSNESTNELSSLVVLTHLWCYDNCGGIANGIWPGRMDWSDLTVLPVLTLCHLPPWSGRIGYTPQLSHLLPWCIQGEWDPTLPDATKQCFRTLGVVLPHQVLKELKLCSHWEYTSLLFSLFHGSSSLYHNIVWGSLEIFSKITITNFGIQLYRAWQEGSVLAANQYILIDFCHLYDDSM